MLKLHIFLWFYQRDTIAKLTVGIIIALLSLHLSVRPSVTPAITKTSSPICSHTTSISNVWRVTPVAKQSSVCNSGAKIFFQSMTGGHSPISPSGYVPANVDTHYILLLTRV